MTLIFCVDNNFGLMFNKRRQSRDSAVIDDIKDSYGKIHISAYSERLFSEADIDYEVCEDFFNCDKNTICFVEDKYSSDLLSLADEVILYHWGRRYPADVNFDIALLSTDFTLAETSVFKGTSHNEIKKERYTR